MLDRHSTLVTVGDISAKLWKNWSWRVLTLSIQAGCLEVPMSGLLCCLLGAMCLIHTHLAELPLLLLQGV